MNGSPNQSPERWRAAPEFAIDLPKVPTEVNQADPKHVTQFFVGFDTIGGISMKAISRR